jgi:prepilin-type N-terminal cleavage/methylation domain-containing protein
VRREKTGFTLVELLTVLAIVALLVGLLIPSLTVIRNTAKEAKQKAQFTEIGLALTAFRNDYGDYPPSNWMLPPGSPGAPGPLNYCGAQKLTEALLGWDLIGFHPKSVWRADGFDGLTPNGPFTYDPDKVRDVDGDGIPDTFNERKGSYLERATAYAFKLGDLYGPALAASALSTSADTFVICDSFAAKKVTLVSGETVNAGTPILYFKANTASKNITAPAPFQRIYNVMDNVPLIDQLQSVEENIANAQDHPLGDATALYQNFYNYIRDPKVTVNPWPYRPDSYLLISAGMDGLYGTKDDICNFGK